MCPILNSFRVLCAERSTLSTITGLQQPWLMSAQQLRLGRKAVKISLSLTAFLLSTKVGLALLLSHHTTTTLHYKRISFSSEAAHGYQRLAVETVGVNPKQLWELQKQQQAADTGTHWLSFADKSILGLPVLAEGCDDQSATTDQDGCSRKITGDWLSPLAVIHWTALACWTHNIDSCPESVESQSVATVCNICY